MNAPSPSRSIPVTYFRSPPVGLLTIAVLCVLAGCSPKAYELQLTPDGETMQRTLTVSQGSTNADSDDDTSRLSATELAHMREFYDPALEQIKGGTHSFVGSFEGEMPADVGGAGSYAFFESPLGSTSLYTERFRGEDDLQEVMQSRNKAVDQLIDLLINWAREEFAGQPIQGRVESLLDQDIRRDLKNLSVYGWTFEMIHDLGAEAVGQRFAARVGMYLVERDYLSLADLPNILRVFAFEDQQAMAELLHDKVIQKLQVSDDESAVASLAILRDPERLATSLRESIRKSEIYQTELAQYKRSRGLDGSVKVKDSDFDPLGLLTKYTFQAMLPSLFVHTKVKVTLNCGVKPFATNAVWNPDENAVEWSENIADDNIPAMMFAAWSLPSEDFQEKCFGETILTGEPLAQFVYWYRGLSDEQRQQYDAFLDTLAPGSGLVEKIEESPELSRSLLKKAIKDAR